MMDMMEINRRRDAKLRFVLLSQLYHARGRYPSGGVSGPTLMLFAQSAMPNEGVEFEDEAHAMQLIRDLIDRGLAEWATKPRAASERFALKHVTMAKITAKGSDLHDWLIDPDPAVDDGRVKD